MSSNLADQLNVSREELESPMVLQLAVQGSRSKVNTRAKVKVDYQSISEDRYFDIININSYDLILGTPFLHQHQICIGLNPARVVIGSDVSRPIRQGPDQCCAVMTSQFLMTSHSHDWVMTSHDWVMTSHDWSWLMATG